MEYCSDGLLLSGLYIWVAYKLLEGIRSCGREYWYMNMRYMNWD